MTHLPQSLALRLKELFTKEEQVFLEEAFSQVKRPTTLRINILKSTLEQIEIELQKAHISYELCSILPYSLILTQPWDEKKLRELSIYHNGEIYIQWLASQAPVMYFERPVSNETSLKILDACAAPWGKTSQLAALYPDAEIWAFEPSKVRYEKMIHNLKKLGITTRDSSSHLNAPGHSLLLRNSPCPLFQEKGAAVYCIYDSVENIWKYVDTEDYFDMILIDAPCSWEWALSYHNTKFLENWSLRHIKKNYARQKTICDAVLPYLKNWWEMIYSTCTLAPEENEAVIHYLLCKYPELALKKLDFIENKYIKYKNTLKSFWKYIFRKEISEHSLRVIPSTYSEGFYIAKLLKK